MKNVEEGQQQAYGLEEKQARTESDPKSQGQKRTVFKRLRSEVLCEKAVTSIFERNLNDANSDSLLQFCVTRGHVKLCSERL